MLYYIINIHSIYIYWIYMAHLPQEPTKTAISMDCSKMFSSNISKSAMVNADCSIPWNRKKLLFKETVAYRLQSVMKKRCFLKQTTILLQKKHVWKHAILEQLIFPIQLPSFLVLHNNSLKQFHSCKIKLPGLIQYFTDCIWNNIFHNYTLITWFFTKVHAAKEGYLTGKSAHPSDTLQWIIDQHFNV